ncbi:hypothetical protein HDC37_000663 [Microbacterium sp. AK009]|uniref:DUF7657 domain-containing protein n=1 Tax=Microbacterium sp. AK009 TaxID=2723068 RepID=UPI0015CA55BA|nr:hypothetical protein [Microbacterium sp. AK009]NYF15851.1 hypothetical protein [Microbacterium sp. AK009]
MLRENPAEPLGLQFGQSQAVRSDEYGTESPIWLSEMARGGESALNPLTVSNAFFAQIPSGIFSSIVFLDGTLLRLGNLLPHEMLFAMKWWLPSLLLFIGLPVWFRQITGQLRWGYLAAVLIFFAPASMWWSGRPVNTLGFVAAGCALAIFATNAFERRWWTRGVVAVLGAGVLLARLPTYYQPLAIVIGVPVVVATAVVILCLRTSWRHRLVSLGAIVLSGLFWTGLLFWEARDAVAAGLSTLYPGDRRSTGGPVEFGRVFGGTNYAWLEAVGPSGATFETELATSFNVLIVIVVLLFTARRWRGGRMQAGAAIPIVAATLFWLSWCTISWGPVGELLPIINRVPDFRAAQGAGFLATIAFCLFMAQWRPSRRVAVPLTAAAVAGGISAYAGSSLQLEMLPGLTNLMVWVSAIITAGAVFLLVRWPTSWLPPLLTGLAAVAMTATATPVLFGLGDLRDSDTAKEFLAWGDTARAEGTVWASDDGYVDALLMSTATPSLSSRQQIGPNVENWMRLDPTGEHEDMWNRGGLHIQFDWTDSAALEWSMPSPDMVVISGSPCVVADRIPELKNVVSSQPLTDGCLALIDELPWSGRQHYIYEVAVP